MGVAISRALHDRLLALAAADPGREVCGLLFGTDDCVASIQPCVNVSPSPQDTFEIDPAALIAAYKAERAEGPAIMGCYHSHPNGVTALSGRDRDAMIGAWCWIVIAGGHITAWRTAGSSLVKLQVETYL